MLNLKTTFIDLAFAALFADGCSKKETASTPPPARTLNGRELVNGADSNTVLQPELRQLNTAADSFLAMTGRFPTDFQKLAVKIILSQVPTPPPGKTFIRNQKLRQVQLLDQ